jgi:hypothetical protein
MNMVDKLPAMADDALKNLHANAVRLGEAGTAQQRASATALLPAIEAELSARKAAKQERLAEGRRARSKKLAAAAAAAG